MSEGGIEKEKNQPRGLVLELPTRFQIIPPVFPDKQPDRLVGILIETDNNRNQLLKETAEAIKSRNHICVIHVDVDWLKYLNDTINRDVGDQAIRHSVCAVAKNIDETFPQNSELKIRLLRDTHTSDETWFYILNIPEEQWEILEKLKKQITTKSEIFFPNKAGRGIDFSVGFSYSSQDKYRKLLEDTREKLENGQLELPYDLFNQLKEDSSFEAHNIKMAKILSIINKVQEQNDVKSFIKVAIEELGGLRIAPEILRHLLEEVVKRSHKQ